MERDDISLQYTCRVFRAYAWEKGERVICYLSALYDTEMQSCCRTCEKQVLIMLVLKPVAQVEKSTCLTAARKLWQLDFCSNAFVNLHPNRIFSFFKSDAVCKRCYYLNKSTHSFLNRAFMQKTLNISRTTHTQQLTPEGKGERKEGGKTGRGRQMQRPAQYCRL